jgi:SsrA-binding protein
MKIIARNKKAGHEYNIEKKIEAGISLLGSEVKSLRAGKLGFADSFARIRKNEAFLLNLNIPPFDKASIFNHEPTRKRKLLLHRQEINKLGKKTREAGYTLVPLEIYFNDKGIIKVQLGLAKGKKTPDKKASLIEKQKDREAKRAVKQFKRSSI